MPDLLTEMNRSLGALATSMGIVITEASVEEVRASMPVAGNTQPIGLLHGGASAVLAETLGSIAALMHGHGRVPVGVSLNCIHHRSATEGSVHAVAHPVKLGSTLTTHAISITDDAGHLLCSATLVCYLKTIPANAAVVPQ